MALPTNYGPMALPTHFGPTYSLWPYGLTYSPRPHLLTMAPLTLQMLDELLADTLCRHALRLSRRQSRVSESRVLGAAHRQLANRAMLDELLTQLQVDPNPNPNPDPNPHPDPTPHPDPNPHPTPHPAPSPSPAPAHPSPKPQPLTLLAACCCATCSVHAGLATTVVAVVRQQCGQRACHRSGLAQPYIVSVLGQGVGWRRGRRAHLVARERALGQV
jgi:hypothetical protein